MKVFVNRLKNPVGKPLDVCVHSPSDSTVKLLPGQYVTGTHYERFAGKYGPLVTEEVPDETAKPIASADRADYQRMARRMAGNPEMAEKVAERTAELKEELVEQLAQEEVKKSRKPRPEAK